MGVLASILSVAIILICLCLALSGSGDDGASGEHEVSRKLRAISPEYIVLEDIYLPLPDGTTTQVDQIVVSIYGVFVIEAKDYSGWIFGNESQRQWTQTLHIGWGDTEKHHFQNPIRQNWRHIYALSDLLNLPRRYFHNVIAFSSRAEFRTLMPDNVMYRRHLRAYIKSFDVPLLSEAGVERTVAAIRRWANSVTAEQREAHVDNLIRRHDPKCLSVAVAEGKLKCVKCGARMVLRHRKSDGKPFYGCSRFPACRSVIPA